MSSPKGFTSSYSAFLPAKSISSSLTLRFSIRLINSSVILILAALLKSVPASAISSVAFIKSAALLDASDAAILFLPEAINASNSAFISASVGTDGAVTGCFISLTTGSTFCFTGSVCFGVVSGLTIFFSCESGRTPVLSFFDSDSVSGSASTTPDVLFSSITTGTVESDTGLLFPSGTEFKTSATGGTALLRCTKRATAEPILANIIISIEINVTFLFFFLGTAGISTLFSTVSSPSSFPD